MSSRGFTLLEILCALAICAVLLALGMPALRRPLAAAAVRTATSQAMAGLALARRTALASGDTVTFCLTTDLVGCSLAGTQWMVFRNGPTGSAAVRESGEALVQRWPLPRDVEVTGTRAYAWYLPKTRAASTLTWNFCHAAAPEALRSLIVSQTGRPRLSAPARPSSPPPFRCPSRPGSPAG